MRNWRLAHVALHLLRGVVTAATVYGWADAAGRERLYRRWSARLLEVLAIRLEVAGEVPGDAPVLLVGNHVSWIDIFAVAARVPVRFVGKSEIRGWPVIGWLTERAGTLFIERGKRRDAVRVSELIAERLRAGDRFAVFPEGTTTVGDVLLKFHASLIQPAVLAAVPVVPVAIRYLRPDGSLCREAAYDGDRTLMQTLREMVGLPCLTVRVEYGSPIDPTGRDRREIANQAREAIGTMLAIDATGAAHAAPGKPAAEKGSGPAEKGSRSISC